MAKVYATLDNDGRYICRDANIRVFDRLEYAEKYLHDANPTEWLDEGLKIQITEGSFGDCWMKVRKAPKVGDSLLTPFNFNAVSIQAPGTHPGGSGYWLTPRPEILVATLIDGDVSL